MGYSQILRALEAERVAGYVRDAAKAREEYGPDLKHPDWQYKKSGRIMQFSGNTMKIAKRYRKLKGIVGDDGDSDGDSDEN
jgi:hypothetical protein